MSKDFLIVDDATAKAVRESKPGKGRRPTSPVTIALLDGKTLWFPNTDKVYVSVSTLRARGLSLHRRSGDLDGVSGFYVWADKKVEKKAK